MVWSFVFGTSEGESVVKSTGMVFKSPLGVHSIDSMVSSIRKTTVKKLKKAGVSVTEIMAITGHKNQQSIADYDELDDEDHMRLSRVLSNDNTLTPSTTKTLEQNTLMQPAFNNLYPPSHVHQLLCTILVQFSTSIIRQ